LPIEKRYRVFFRGEIIPGQQEEEVKKRIAALYKVSVKQCNRLFTGRIVTIKDNLDYSIAKKYKMAFEKAGAKCHIKEMKK
jgi:hypothetical protein